MRITYKSDSIIIEFEHTDTSIEEEIAKRFIEMLKTMLDAFAVLTER